MVRLENIYKSIIRLIFEYANFPFISVSDSNFSKVQKIENKIVRLCLSSSIYDSTVKIHETAQLDLLKPRLLQTSTKYISNMLTKKTNIPIRQLIPNQEQFVSENSNILLHRKNRKTCLDSHSNILELLHGKN